MLHRFLIRLRPIPVSLRAVWSVAPRVTSMLVLGSIAVAGLAAAEVLLVRRVVETLETSQNATVPLVLFGVAAALRRTVASGMQQGQLYMARRTEQRMTLGVLRTASQASFEEFEHPEFRDRVARALLGARTRTWSLVWSLNTTLTTLITVALLVVVITSITPSLIAILAAAGVALLAASLVKSRAGSRLIVADTQDDRERAYLRAALISTVEGREIRLHGTADRLIDQHEIKMARFLERLARTIRQRLAADLLSNAVLSMALVAALVVVARRASSGELSIADAAAVAVAAQQLASQLQALSNATGSIAESALLLEDLGHFTVPDEKPTPTASGHSEPTELLLDGCTYRYPGAASAAVREVSLRLERGSVVALVGANGSGKSTVAKLLTGLYAPEYGTVALRDASGNVMDVREPLAGIVSAVFQEYGRYELPVMENVTLGSASADPPALDRVERALATVGLRDDIAALPDGLHTRLGRQFTSGQNLSGGQWQRLALARAIHANTPFVVLDEPTASVDAAGERELFTSIRHLFPDAGVLLISHRFATVRTADEIVVLDSGRVVESGTHDELMLRRGVYAGMFETQATHLLGEDA